MNTQEEETTTVPVIAFEYDLKYYDSGNYTGIGLFAWIPVSFINTFTDNTYRTAQEKAFEAFTGFSSYHIIHHDNDEEDYDEQKGGPLVFTMDEEDRQYHYCLCEFCSKIGVRRDRALQAQALRARKEGKQ